MNNMSQYNNTPDEAERLIEELLLPVNTHEAQIGRAYTIGHLLPLIRSGLAMQRLEKAVKCNNIIEASIGFDRNGGWIIIDKTDEDPSEHNGPTIPEAINAALDAAGVK